MAVKEYFVSLDRIDELVNVIKESGLFDDIVGNSENKTVKCYLKETLVLDIGKYGSSSENAKIVYYGKKITLTVSGTSSAPYLSLGKILVMDSGIAFGNAGNYWVFLGSTTDIATGEKGVGCIYKKTSSDTSYYAVAPTSYSGAMGTLYLSSQVAPITVLSNACAYDATDIYDNIYVYMTKESKNSYAGRASLNGREGYANGYIVMLESEMIS